MTKIPYCEKDYIQAIKLTNLIKLELEMIGRYSLPFNKTYIKDRIIKLLDLFKDHDYISDIKEIKR